jgi:hypothetical protein
MHQSGKNFQNGKITQKPPPSLLKTVQDLQAQNCIIVGQIQQAQDCVILGQIYQAQKCIILGQI